MARSQERSTDTGTVFTATRTEGRTVTSRYCGGQSYLPPKLAVTTTRTGTLITMVSTATPMD